MTYAMIRRQHRHQVKRTWHRQRRLFAMPVPEKQIMPVREGLRPDI